ncbi:MAG: ZPR1 zinc finger domain-containing protein [Candidatus Poseidoniaceae archaeon]|jgi:zinc finger protein|nr:ZPR1 zinc finger domain-containing protein [Candidatus Poseidoniaceae archaeon]
MDEVPIATPCPVCGVEGHVGMLTHIDEIPYFGEHTQVTVLCHDCGWRQSDFIPAEGKKPGAWSLIINKPEHIRARVVRSSSCTIRISELDLEVNPGTSSTGYVSNVEGVIDRFMEIIVMVTRQAYVDDSEIEVINQLQKMHTTLLELKEDPIPNPVTLEFLDPQGHSQILHEDSVSRELEPDEFEQLPTGPEPAVFEKNDL